MKRILAPLPFLSILIVTIVLFVLHETVSSNAAAPSITEPATPVEPVAGTSTLPFLEQLALKPNYMLLQSGAADLVGEWSFDEATGTSAADSSGRSLNGSLQNGPTWAGGRYRAGLRFDGVNDYVQVGAPAALVMSNAVSISAWIHPTGTGAAGLGIIVNKEGEYEIARFHDGTIRWALANSAPGWTFIDTGFVAPVNQWTHITLTYDNGQVKTYANGNLVHTYLGSGPIGDVATSMNDFRIGGRQHVEQNFMGLIDEVSVYNYALTATEVTKRSQGTTLRNLALRKPATQSSTGWDSPASLAVDGNTDGDWFRGSVTHTLDNYQAWWQVDLGSVQQIDNVNVFMMTVCCSTHDNFDVKVSSDGSNWTSYYVAGPIDFVSVPVKREARYVRVQLRGSGYLALAEVQVMGVPGAVVPGVIQAEDFDDGGEGISYHDLTPANEGGLYRDTAVDVSACVANNHVIGWNGSGEWTQYSINVLNAGTYTFQAVFGEESTGSLHVEIDGVDRTGPITITNTGGWCTLQTLSKSGIFLTPGRHTMRVVTDNVGVVLDSFRFVAQTTPYSGTPANIPGIIQVEAYDEGGEGLAYHDNTPTNEAGSTFRAPTGVDVWEGGIGYAQAGEWLLYTVNVTTTGTYTVGASVGAVAAGASIHIEIDGIDKTGPMIVPNTGSWSSYQTISKSGVQLTAGLHTMRLVLDTNSGTGYVANFDLINFTLVTPNAAAYLSQSVPTSMVAGQLYNVSVTMQNIGSNTWTTAGSYNLGTQNPQDNSTWSLFRVALPNSQSVAPGQPVTFTFPIRAPGTPGTYNFQMQMVQDGVEWFGAKTPNVIVTVGPSNQPPKAIISGSQVTMAGSPIIFSSQGSADPDGTIAGYSWNFGDGQTASDANPSHTYSAGGNYVVTLTVTDNTGATSTATTTVAVIETSQSALNNSTVPGTIQAEDFDYGGPGVAYHDDSPGNFGGSAYRPGDNVDIENNTATGGGYAVGWARAGEWLEYIVQVPDTDNYNLEVRVASPSEGGTGGMFHLEIDGSNKTGPIAVPNTGGAWTTVTKSGLRLTNGPHVLRLVMDSGGSSGSVGRFDYFKFTATQTPYGGTARSLPGTIQAEDFDNGQPGTSYSDTTPGNQGGAYRNTDVDIWNSSEGPAIGWTQKGEYWDYTVDVPQNDTYTVAVRAASPGNGAKFHLEVDGFVMTNPISIPATGSRDGWQTVQTSVKLPVGRHILRLVVDDVGSGGEVCFNSFTVSVSSPKLPPAEAALGAKDTFTNVDYSVFGVRNLVNPSNFGEFAVGNIRNVKRAILVWWGVPNGILDPSKIKFAGRDRTGFPFAAASNGTVLFGHESRTHWLDVTDIVLEVGANRIYTINTTTTVGASLIILWDDGIASNNRDITIFSGNEGNIVWGSPFGFDTEGWDALLTGVNYSGGTANLQLHVAEGDPGQPEDKLVIANTANPLFRRIEVTQPRDPRTDFPDVFQGDSVPPFFIPIETGRGLWDIKNFNITNILSNGSNNLRITTGKVTDVIFLVLAVVDVPHPVPTVNITDAKANVNNRVPGVLNGTTQKSLIGGPIILEATGNTAGTDYKWTFTGPVHFINGADSRTVSFETKDDRVNLNEQAKSVHKVTAKVVFTNSAGEKAEASVNIDVLLPALPVFRGTPGASTVEKDQEPEPFEAPLIVWHMGSEHPNNKQPAMTFTAESRIPDGPYLSNLEDSQITFQQAINVMRKVRDSWGKESCITTRRTPEAFDPDKSDLGWRFDNDTFPDRVREFQGSTKHFAQSAAANNTRSLSINFQEGIDGIKFGQTRTADKLGPNPHNLGTDLIAVDAAEVDDRYETSVMYSARNYSYPLGTVKWKWSGKIAFDTSWQKNLGVGVPPFSHLPPTEPVSEYYRFITNTSSSGTQEQTISTTAVAGSVVDAQFKWMQCPQGMGKPWPISDFFPINANQHGFVQLLYREALRRSPFDLDFTPSLEIPHRDRKGYHFWASNITRNGFDDAAINGYRVHVGLAFIFSTEFRDLNQEDENMKDLSRDRHTPEYYRAFVWACYRLFLQRNPGQPGRFTTGDAFGDFSGLNHWFEKLRDQDSRRANDDDTYAFYETVAAFLASQEYKERVERDPDLRDFFNDILESEFNHPAPRFIGPLQQ